MTINTLKDISLVAKEKFAHQFGKNLIVFNDVKKGHADRGVTGQNMLGK